VTIELWLVRHGETEWSKTGQHTGRTDLPLTEVGIAKAKELRRLLDGQKFEAVFTSPLKRAAETCRLAGFENPTIDPNLQEWDYGAYEGKTTHDIRKERPDWDLWRDGVENGESIDEVARRADQVIESAVSVAQSGRVALFAHGHILRVLTARWLSLTPDYAKRFALTTASLSILSYERDTRVISRWNQTT